MTDTYISPNATIHENSFIGRGVVILGPAIIEENVVIEDYTIIGKPSEAQLLPLRDRTTSKFTYEEYDACVDTQTIIKSGCMLGRNCLIYSGTTLGEGVVCEDNIRIGWDTTVGAHTRLMYSALIYQRITIGEHCRVSGFLCNDTVLGDYVSMSGETIHSYYYFAKEDYHAPSPNIGSHSVISFGSKIVGGVTIGERSYVAANAIVTKDVPPKMIVRGANELVAPHDWSGALRDSGPWAEED